MLKKEIMTGINEIKDYVLENIDKCIYHFKEINDDVLYNKLKRKLCLYEHEKEFGGFERE